MPITGNITLNRRPKYEELRTDCICLGCLEECEEVPIDDSFSDGFGNVECWSTGSSCCGSEVGQGRIFLDRTTYHTARKDHKDGKVKAGQRYKARIRKGYAIDDDGNHIGIYEYIKRVLQS
jgi:hypothetical protein